MTVINDSLIANTNHSIDWFAGVPSVVGLANGGFVVAYQESFPNASSLGVAVALYGADGNKVTPDFLVNTSASGNLGSYTTGTNPSVAALSNGNFVVVWQASGANDAGQGIYSQIFSSSGVKIGSETHVNTYTTNNQYLPVVNALADGGYAVAWNSTGQNGQSNGVYAQEFSSQGIKNGSEIKLTIGDNWGSILAPSFTQITNGNLVNVSYSADLTTIRTLDGTLVTTASYGWRYDPSISALQNGNYVVACFSGGDVAVDIFTSTGAVVNSMMANTYATSTQRFPAVKTLSNGNFVVTWNSQYQDGDGWGVYAQLFTQDGVKVGSEIAVNSITAGDQLDPQIAALANGGFVITWGAGSNIYAQEFNASGVAQTIANNIPNLQINVSQLGSLSNYAGIYSCTLLDTGANIVTNIASLQANLSKITSITLSDIGMPLNITAAQFTAGSDVLNKISGYYIVNVSGVTTGNLVSTLNNNYVSTVSISDAAGLISANWDLLQANVAKITSITPTGSGTPYLPITLAQLANDAYAVALLPASGYNLQVSGVPISSIGTALANSKVTSVSVSDTAANIAAHLDTLNSLGSKLGILTVTSGMNSDGTFSVTPTQLATYSSFLSHQPSLILRVTDVTAASVSNYLATSGVVGVTVSDTGANIVANSAYLSSLASMANSQLVSVTQTDSAPLAITFAQYQTTYPLALKLTGSYTLAVSGVTVAQMSAILNDTHVVSVGISDLSANIATSLNSLQTLVPKISSITPIDVAPLRLSVDQLISDVAVLQKLPANTLAAITDSSLVIGNNFDTLKADLSRLSSIALTDPQAYVPVTIAQALADAGVFAKFTTTPNLMITDLASHFNGLDLSAYKGDKVDLVVSSLDSNMTVSGGAVTKVDLTHLVDATYNTKTVNGGVDTQIDVIASGTGHSILLHGELPSQVQIAANYSSSINGIASVGLSPDQSTLIIKFTSGAVSSIPFSAGSGSIDLGGTHYQTSDITSKVAPQAVFSNATGGSNSYVLPDKFTGDASLHLDYQLINNDQNAVITGSTSNDFIKVANTASTGKAVNGGGGSDVIDGGVGSTFVTGGTSHANDTFFLDGRAPGVSWSTITDFKTGSDQATIWGFIKGVSSVDTSFTDPNNEGAGGIYSGLTLHFKNLLPDGQASGTTADLNSITLSGHTLADIGVSSLTDLNNQINQAAYNATTGQYLVNSHLIIGQTQDAQGTHGYLFVH